jgi:hypothetical protein
VRKVTAYLVIALVAAGCRDAAAPTLPPSHDGLSIRESPSPFMGVTAGDVHALVPDRWTPRLAGVAGGFENGFVASPAPRAASAGLPGEGMAAVWIDGTKVGVPSDYYYLVAHGAAVDRLTDAPTCHPSTRVFLDRRPTFADGRPGSPGDYVATGQGVCGRTAGATTRFAYFVAAPGYGPVRRLGIAASGLYVVVAFVPDSRRAPAILDKLLYRTRFGGASVEDIIRAAKAARGRAAHAL